MSWHMSIELNDLTRQLYAQGYTREHHPDTVYWSDYQNLGYKWETKLRFTWETPCGLMIQGESVIGRSLACADTTFNNVWYCPENNNPLLRCPFDRKDCPHLPDGFPLAMCPCHQTQTPYDYQNSVEKIDTERAKAAKQQYMELTGGIYCACVVGNNGYQGGWYEVKYDVDRCISVHCKNPVCAIRKQPRDLSRVNVFYDIRRTWITQVGFLKERRVEVTKGVKVFPKPISRTDAEIWLQTRQASFNPITSKTFIDCPKKTADDRKQEFFSKMHRQYGEYEYFEFHYDVENIRIARSDQRDLLQDLLDVAEGIEVIHAADTLKAAKEQKRTRRAAAKAQKIRKAEKMLLTFGWEGLDGLWKRRVEKLLDADRIDELLQCWTAEQMKPAQPAMEQISMFPEDTLPPAFEGQQDIA